MEFELEKGIPMPLALRTWLRPDYTPTGHEARVDYAVFGSFDLSVAIDRETYRSERLPAGFELLQFDRTRNGEAYRKLFEQPAWKLAAADDPRLAAAAADAPQMALLRGTVRDPQTLNDLRDSIGIVAYLLDRGGLAVYDPQLLQFWSPGRWRSAVFAPARPVPHEHVVIVRSPEANRTTQWIHTRGLRLFGRPDLSVHGVGPKYPDGIVELFNRYIEYQANGGEILAGDTVTLAGLPPGGVCHPDARLDHPDFGNAHVEFVWPAGALTES